MSSNSREDVVVVQGFAVRIGVHRGHLVVRDGVASDGRERLFSRATGRVRRLVVLGQQGTLTLEALRWLADLEIGFVHIARDGRLLSASAGMGLDDPRLRRAQAASWSTPTGMAIARELLRRKLAGQGAIANRLQAIEVGAQIRRLVPTLVNAPTPAQMLLPEAAAASAYWAAWAPLELRWAKADQAKIPDHWRTVGGRASPITGNPRSAANPANALLNYLYALLEAEARLACLVMGLDPGLGVLHADQRARDSLALDVMEAVRPDVDGFVLDLLERRTFRRAEFFESRQGVCRIMPPLTHELADTLPAWSARLGPVVEWVAKALMAGPDVETRRVPTRLTGTHRSEGRASIRRGASRSSFRSVPIARTCRTCGGPTPDRGRDYCDACLPEDRAAQAAAFTAAGHTRVAELRVAGVKPGIGGTAGRSRGAKVVSSLRAIHAWNEEHPEPVDSDRFKRELLPRLAGCRAGSLARATGLSRPYCSAILRGDRTPHPRWWPALDRTAAAMEA